MIMMMRVFGLLSDERHDAGAGQLAVFDTAEADDGVGEPAHLVALALDDHDLDTVIVVQMHVCSAADLSAIVMLDVYQPGFYAARVVVIDDGQSAHHFAIGKLPLALQKTIAHHIADGFRTIVITLLGNQAIESLQQFFGHTYAEALDFVHVYHPGLVCLKHICLVILPDSAIKR